MDRKRRPRKRRLTSCLVIRIDRETMEACRHASTVRNYPSVSAWFREAVSRAAAGTARRDPPRRPSAELARQIARNGNNLNQIARRVNGSAHPQRVRILSELALIEERLAALQPGPDNRC